MSHFIYHIKLRRFYFFLNNLESNIHQGIYFEGETSKIVEQLLQDKNIIYFEFSSRLKQKIKKIALISIVVFFFWFQLPLFIFLLRILYKLFLGGEINVL